jgi:hypothetical protein
LRNILGFQIIKSKLGLIWFFLLLSCISQGQETEISGKVTGKKGIGISRINILVYLPDSTKLIAFDVSNENGLYNVLLNTISDSLTIEVSSVNYRNIIKNIANKTQHIDFVLTPETMQLKTVTIRAPAIEQHGDTITYLVSSFASKQDRSIEDVLRRMPGIEIEPSGRILYQGLPLNKFYVEGLDLMDGKYTLVSKNLPQEAVGTVEILENHQPLKILEDKVSSSQAAINIKLKKGVTATGTANLGVGATPLLWDVNISPMFFTKKFQALFSYQSNNTGNDLAAQLNTYTLQDISRKAGRPAETPEILSIQSATKPNIENTRFLDNNVHLANLNVLTKLSRNIQFRANVYYINDYQQEPSVVKRSLFSPEDTLMFTEIINNNLYNNKLYSKFTISRNEKNNYLNNELKLISSWDNKNGIVIYDGNKISQQLNSPFKSFSNTLETINQIGKQLFRFNSYISYDNSPHRLNVEPGLFESVLNDSIAYDNTSQNLNLKRFYANHSASYIFNFNNFAFSPVLGYSYRQQLLTSNIIANTNTIQNNDDLLVSNNLQGTENKLYGQIDIEYHKSKIIIKSKLPVLWHNVSLIDNSINDGQKLNKFFFNPSLSVNYKISNFWKTIATLRLNNSVGDIDNVNYGFILRNYRSLSKNSAPLAQKKLKSVAYSLSYKNPISSLFGSFSYIYYKIKSNLIYSNIVLENGTSVIQSFPIPNTANSHSWRANISKFFSKTKTTISLTSLFNQTYGKSLLNGVLFNTKNIFVNIKPSINIRLKYWFNIQYELNGELYYTYVEKEEKNNYSIYRHNLNMFAFPFRKQQLSLTIEYYQLYQQNNYFVDFSYKINIPHKKMEIELKWNNILNYKTYISYQSYNFTVWESAYQLRPSQLMLTLHFGI